MIFAPQIFKSFIIALFCVLATPTTSFAVSETGPRNKFLEFVNHYLPTRVHKALAIGIPATVIIGGTVATILWKNRSNDVPKDTIVPKNIQDPDSTKVTEKDQSSSEKIQDTKPPKEDVVGPEKDNVNNEKSTREAPTDKKPSVIERLQQAIDRGREEEAKHNAELEDLTRKSDEAAAIADATAKESAKFRNWQTASKQLQDFADNESLSLKDRIQKLQAFQMPQDLPQGSVDSRRILEDKRKSLIFECSRQYFNEAVKPLEQNVQLTSVDQIPQRLQTYKDHLKTCRELIDNGHNGGRVALDLAFVNSLYAPLGRTQDTRATTGFKLFALSDPEVRGNNVRYAFTGEIAEALKKLSLPDPADPNYEQCKQILKSYHLPKDLSAEGVQKIKSHFFTLGSTTGNFHDYFESNQNLGSSGVDHELERIFTEQEEGDDTPSDDEINIEPLF